MKRAFIIAASILGIVILFVTTVSIRIRSGRADVIIRKLSVASGPQRQQLIMRLDTSHGDIIGALVNAIRTPSNSEQTRADLIDILFSTTHSSQTEDSLQLLQESINDPSPLIRMAVVQGFILYGDRPQRLLLFQHLSDPAPEIRRALYIAFAGMGRKRRHRSGIWRVLLDKEHRQTTEQTLLQTIARETDPQLLPLAKGLMGRIIAKDCADGLAAQQKAALATAEELYSRALRLDPLHHRPIIRLTRMMLHNGQPTNAVTFATQHNALLRIPLLPSAPTIDGDPSDQVWLHSLSNSTFFANGSPWIATPSQGRSQYFIGHHSNTIYIAVIGYEKHLDKLAVTHTIRDSEVWRDDCIELFFDPSADETDYYQFVVNAAGVVLDSYRSDVSRSFKCRSSSAIFPKRRYWACEFALPATALGNYQLTSSSIWGINIMRTRIGPGSEQCAAWPTFGGSHNPQRFPIAIFTGLDHASSKQLKDGAK